MKKSTVIIGSRGSKLALWQSEWVKAQLEQTDLFEEVRLEIIKTSGDRQLDVSLASIGGKGVFTKEIEEALINKRIDVAVHSLKDLPTVIEPGLAIGAITRREDPRDALVLPASFNGEQLASIMELPPEARVGTSSPRRLAQLKHLRPDLNCIDIRGNVDTRLRKLDDGEYDAIVLACAGLRRLGLEKRITYAISIDEMLPAVSQGALGIQIRSSDHELANDLSVLNHPATAGDCVAERALLRTLGGGCQLPIAGHARVEGDHRVLRGLVAAVNGQELVKAELSTELDSAESMGEQLGLQLLGAGARELMGTV